MTTSTQRYRLSALLVGSLLALLYTLVVTGNARADGLDLAADPAVNSALQAADGVTGALALPSGAQPVDAASAADQAPQPMPQPAPIDPPAPAATSQQASTGQAATATSAVTQQQPRNLVISIRINSPGNDGPISQTNVTGSVAGSSNDGSTDQGGASGGQQASEQQAATDQAATATAAATQEQPQNIVILIRINSPGDNGPIDQTNTTVAISNAGNVGVTSQGGTGNGAEDGTTTGASPDPRAAIGPPAQQAPAQQESPAATPAGALPQMSVALLAPAAPKTAIATAHRVDRPAPAAHTGHRPSDNRAGSAPSRSAASSEPTDLPAAARSGAREPQARVTPAHRSPATRGNRAVSRDPGVGRRAVDFLGKMAPRPPLQASADEKDVTNAVVFTLIAVLGGFLVFFGSTYGSTYFSSGLRLLDPRKRWHG